LKFENIGGNATTTMYSLYDYSTNPFGRTAICIEVNRQTKEWWFVSFIGSLNVEHMKALHEFLEQLLEG
jgi:hypothetical protein